MNKTRLAVAISLAFMMSVPVAAESLSCEEISKLARKVMTARQENVPMVLMMQSHDGSETARKMILAAYKESRFNSPRMQQNSITDFENDWYMKCYEKKMM
jgi:hypothetical protein